MGPAAQALLRSSGMSLRDVTPSGPHGIVTKGDVLAAMQGGGKAASQEVFLFIPLLVFVSSSTTF